MSFLGQLRSELSMCQRDGIASGLNSIPLVFEVQLDHATELDWDVIPDEPALFSEDTPRVWCRVVLHPDDSIAMLNAHARVLLAECIVKATQPKLRDLLQDALDNGEDE